MVYRAENSATGSVVTVREELWWKSNRVVGRGLGRNDEGANIGGDGEIAAVEQDFDIRERRMKFKVFCSRRGGRVRRKIRRYDRMGRVRPTGGKSQDAPVRIVIGSGRVKESRHEKVVGVLCSKEEEDDQRLVIIERA